jgi:hypothetical protein
VHPPHHGPPRWIEHLSYGLVAFGAVSAALFTAGHVVGDGVDLYGTFWFYWWIADCIGNLRDPSFTDLMFFPLGKDIFAHTGNNFVDAVLAAPLLKLLGFPRFQPVFVGLVLWGNALAMRPLARKVVGAGWGAWTATLLWQIAPFTLFELMTGRLTQALLWFLPLAVFWFLRIGEASPGATLWQRTRAPLLAGLFTALQAWTYWFMGYFMALAFAGLAAAMLVRPPAPRRRLISGWLQAGVVCLIFIGPAFFAMSQAAGGGDVPGLPDEGGLFDSPGQLANNVAATLHGYALMEAHGQPMFANVVWGGGLLAFLIVGRDRLRWGAVLALTFAFAMGAAVPWGEGPPLPMPHYLVAYRVLPFFDRLWFPYRFIVIAFLAASLGIGIVVTRVNGWRARAVPRLPAWLLPVALVTLAMFEQNRHLAFPLIHRDLTPPAVYSVIGQAGGALIELPIGLARVSIAWQPVHQQPTFGGMAENAPLFWPDGYRRRMSNTLIRRLRQATRAPDETHDHRDRDQSRLLNEGYRWVVLDRHLVDSDLHRWSYGRKASPDARDQAPFVAQARVTEALGPPVMVEGALVVWDLLGGAPVPAALEPTAENLSTRSWRTDDMPAYEAHLREIGRIPEH